MLVYCDFIMHTIRNALVVSSSDYMAPVRITSVGSTEWDLDEGGALASTTKRLKVKIGDKEYRVTVEEA
jgi:hypothetical protein